MHSSDGCYLLSQSSFRRTEAVSLSSSSLSLVDSATSSPSLRRRSVHYSTERLSSSLLIVQSRRLSAATTTAQRDSPLASRRHTWFPLYAPYLLDGPLSAYSSTPNSDGDSISSSYDSEPEALSAESENDAERQHEVEQQVLPEAAMQHRKTVLGNAVRKGLSILRRRSTRRHARDDVRRLGVKSL